jgi:hypothetical protein
MVQGKKIILTPEQEEWLKNNFPNTANAKLAKHLDISEASIHRFARKFGLKKSADFMEQVRQWASEGSNRWFRIHGTNHPPGYTAPWLEKYQFKKGVTSLDRLGKEKEEQRQRKMRESRNKTIKTERARILFGLEQKTKLKLVAMDRKKVLFRYYVRRQGYLVDDDARVIYYTNTTKRGKRIEAKVQPWYTFRPHEDYRQTN